MTVRIFAPLSVLPEQLTLRRTDDMQMSSYQGNVWLRTQGQLDRSTIRLVGEVAARAESLESEGGGNLVPIKIHVNSADLSDASNRKLMVEIHAKVDGKAHTVPLTLILSAK